MITCPRCRGAGMVNLAGVRQRCPDCKGSGHVEWQPPVCDPADAEHMATAWCYRSPDGYLRSHRADKVRPLPPPGVCRGCGGPDDHYPDCLPASQGGTQPDVVRL